MFPKIFICFVLWYVMAQLTIAYIGMSGSDLFLSYVFAFVSYVLFPIASGAFIFSSNK